GGRLRGRWARRRLRCATLGREPRIGEQGRRARRRRGRQNDSQKSLHRFSFVPPEVTVPRKAAVRDLRPRAFLLRAPIFCFALSETGLPFRCVKRWFDRTFPVGLPVAEAPALLIRLGRTPDRIAAALH